MNFAEKFKYCPVCGSPKFVVNDTKSKRCEECGFIYYLNPSAATAAFIRNEEGSLLVCRRANEPAKGTLDLPGGFSDYDETSEACISREIYEETGLKTKSVRYLFSLPNKYLYSGLVVPTMDMFFECTLEKETNLRPSDDVDACYFIPICELNPSFFGLESIQKAVQMFIDREKTDVNKINFETIK